MFKKEAEENGFGLGCTVNSTVAWQKGAEFGYNKANKWHDLEKDPNDLPKDCKTMCICLSDYGSKYESVPRVWIGCHDILGWSDYMGSSLYSNVRFWRELPIQVKEIKEN